MQSPIAHICRHRARTDAQRAAIARNRTHLHVHPTNMCLIQGTCLVYALLLRTLLRTFLRALLRALRRRRRSQLAAHAVLQAPHPAFVPHKRSTRAQTTCTVCALRCAAYALPARCVCRRVTAPLDAVPCRCAARHCSPVPQGTACASLPTPLAATPFTAARPR